MAQKGGQIRSGKSTEKSLQIGKASATGSLKIFTGLAVSTLIMAIGTIVLGNLLHEDGYGLYTITLIPALMGGLFRDWGVNSALTKFIAGLRQENDDTEIRRMIVAGLTFEVAVGLVLTLISLLSADFVATSVYHRPESGPLISIISIAIFGNGLFNTAQSSFIGFERMGLNSLVLICQAIVKAAVGPVLVILGYGVVGASIGHTAASLSAGLIGITALYFVVIRRLRKAETTESGSQCRPVGLRDRLMKMLRYGVPLSVSTIMTSALAQTYVFMMAFFVSDDTILGNYSTATNFAVLITFLSLPISTVLFPAFAKLDPKKDRELISRIFKSSVKFTALVLLPATMAIMALSKPMINTLYGETRFVTAPLFLALLVVPNLLAVFGSVSLGSFLSGLGETKMAMKLGIVTITFGLPLGLVLIPAYGVLGVVVGNIVSGMPSVLWGIHWVWKNFKAKADLRSSAKILTVSALAGMSSFLAVSLFQMAAWVQLLLGLAIFLIVYVFVAPMIGALGLADIDVLRSMFSGLGIISKAICIPLEVAERTARFISQSR